jgi:beta-lactamase regulating signal transducer with metallopeptidase domain
MLPTSNIDQIISLSGEVVRWLLTWSAQLCLLLGVVWAALKLDRSRSPLIRYRIWLVALIAAVALPVLTAISHCLHLPGAIAPFSLEIPGDAPPFAEIPLADRPSFSWLSLVWPLLFALWAGGVVVLVLRLSNSLWKLHIIQTGAQRISITDLDCSCSDLLHSDADRVPILLSERVQSPGLAGLLRPVILLPSDIASWTSRAERISILRHELAHIARYDHLVSLFQMALKAFFFFHPMLRYGCNQLSVERELACDDYVIGLGTEPKAYAESILKAAERSLLTDVVHRTASFASGRRLERRIEMILDTSRIRQPLRQWRFLWLPFILIGVITWLVIPDASSRPRLQGGVGLSTANGAPPDSDATVSLGSGPRRAPSVVDGKIRIGSVKRGPMVWQVRGLGVLVAGGDGRLKVEIGVSEPQAKDIAIGQPAAVDTRNGVIPGKVLSVNPLVTNGQITVEISLEGEMPRGVKAGISVDGAIEVGRREDVLHVGRPVHARAESDGTIFKLDDDGKTATRVRVKFGQSSVNLIEIVEGLKIGDKVILSDMGDYEGVETIKLNRL